MTGWLRTCGALLPVLAGCSAPAGPSRGGSEGASADEIRRAAAIEVAACVAPGPEICFNAVDDNCNGLFDEGCGIQGGALQFLLAWDDPGADVDLLVTDPNRELVAVGKVAESGLVRDRDCPGREGGCGGVNLENVYLAKGSPERGKYQVTVRLESLGVDPPPVVAHLGARVGSATKSIRLTFQHPEDRHTFVFRL
jgi:tRNA (guanosine-2'-O-)-methyltransferase